MNDSFIKGKSQNTGRFSIKKPCSLSPLRLGCATDRDLVTENYLLETMLVKSRDKDLDKKVSDNSELFLAKSSFLSKVGHFSTREALEKKCDFYKIRKKVKPKIRDPEKYSIITRPRKKIDDGYGGVDGYPVRTANNKCRKDGNTIKLNVHGVMKNFSPRISSQVINDALSKFK